MPTQHRPSILAACEDPATVAIFNYRGQVWPLPQTGQMWLERELLENPDVPGYWCYTTSYREEPDPVPGRHNLIFPMIEFELKGDFNTLLQFEIEFLEAVGLCPNGEVKELDYRQIAHHYRSAELKAEHETRMLEEFGPAIALKNFPENTSPFWNMKRDGPVAKKCDIILHGIETIGSAERSTDPAQMRQSFMSISGGAYARQLFAKFDKHRVLEELEAFLALPFFPRCGGGIGMNRFIRALELAGKFK